MEAYNTAVIGEVHPRMYLVHRFWARKNFIVINKYIEHYTKPGDIVLDPFMGSGVTAGESLKLGRRYIGVDLNPMAVLISEVTSMPFDEERIERVGSEVLADIKEEAESIYKTNCRRCGQTCIVDEIIWSQVMECPFCLKLITMVKAKKGNTYQCYECGRQIKYETGKVLDSVPIRIRYDCKTCSPNKRIIDDISTDDYSRIMDLKRTLEPKHFYPMNVPLDKSAKRSCEYIHELFEPTALYILSEILHRIKKRTEKDESLRKHLFTVFTSSLAQSSKLNSIDFRENKEWQSRGWTVHNYWIPVGYIEKNPYSGFHSRLETLVAGKKQVNKEILEYEPASNVSEFRSANKNILLRQGDAKDLSFIEDATVDYIFTDPPYGESVPYLGLSLLWGSWLGLDKEFRFESEILISEKEREGMPKTIDQYKTDLQSAFLEMYRVLKPNGWMSVTFHNRDISVWNALVNAAREAHFEYVNDMYLLPRIQSAKSGLAKGGSMTGDIVINFRRPEGIPPRFVSKNIDAEQMMVEEAKQIIVERGGVATLDQLMRGICSVLMKHGVVHKFNDAASIKNVLGIYLKDLGNNKWTLMQAEPETILQTIPLELRIETIIKSCLNDGPKTIDEILVPVFTILNNGRTPEREDVYHVLTSLAEEEKGIWRLKTADQLEFAFVREREGDFRGYGDEESDHNRTILWLAKLGNRAGYRVYVGKNERSKNKDLSEISVSHLDIPYVDETEIKANDIDQIDVIWLSEKNMPAAIFEVENTTRAMTCIRRMDNLLKMSPEVRVYSTIVAPTKMESVVQKRMKSKSSEMVMDDKSLWGYVLYPDLATLYQIVCESTVEVPFVLDSILRIRKMPF